jgi:hypothetical protein
MRRRFGWQRIVDDLLDLSTVEADQDGRRAMLRTAPRPSKTVCRAVGLTLPPVYQEQPPNRTAQEPIRDCGASNAEAP